jgi:competence protein ComEC
MKKLILTLTTIFNMLFFIGCKTPPVQKSILKINKSMTGDLPKDKIKLYFPEFEYFSASQNRNVIASGDCIIVLLPEDKWMIVDTFTPDVKDQLVDFVKKLGVTKIDYLFATHYHYDHIGCMEALIDNFEVCNFYSNDAPFNSSYWLSLEKKLNQNNIAIQKLQKDDFLTLIEGEDACTIKVFSPQLTKEDLYNLYNAPGKTEKLKNSSSLVFKLFYKDFSVLFTGDAYRKITRGLAKEYGPLLKSTILSVPHHGDIYTANDLAFLRKVYPEISVIQDPRYITSFISTNYRIVGSKLLYRDTPGYIEILSDGYTYSVLQNSFTIDY